MAKKGNVNLLYVLGMALVAIGCVLPMFKLGPFSANVFRFMDFDSAGSIGAILLFAGAVAGLVFSFVSVGNASLLKLVALLASIIGGILLFGVDSELGFKILKKVAYIGLYVVLAGWVAACIGYFSNK
jgi:hypothetical protein